MKLSVISHPFHANTNTPTTAPTVHPVTSTPTLIPTSIPTGLPTPLPGYSETIINYTYDPLYRLTAADYSTGAYYHYTYDSVGNRLTQETGLGTTDYTYDNANRLIDMNGVPYTWDNNGNLLNDGVNSYTYDSANQLTGISNQSTVSSYQYSGLGDRLSQTVNAQTTNYTLDLNAGLTQVLNDGTNQYLYGVGRIAQVNTTTDYFLGDALGSVRQLTNSQGNITLAKSYDPYGITSQSFGSGASIYAFTGEQQDISGLTYLRARYYSNGDGRFISRDTWAGDYNSPLSLNRWNYVEANPTNYIDLSGYWALTKNLELYPGGFYGLGRLRMKGGLCLHSEFCYVPSSTWMDIFVSPPEGTGNDIMYNVYQIPDSFDAFRILQGDYYDLINWIERIDGIKPDLGCVYPRRYPDIRIPIPFLNTNWKYATTLHGYSDNFNKGQALLTAFASTNSPYQTLDEMSAAGVQFLDPKTMKNRPFTYGDMGPVGTRAQAFALGVNIWSASRNIAIREFWITIEENISQPNLYRAQITTRRNDGSHYKLWIDSDGWHEDPFFNRLRGTW